MVVDVGDVEDQLLVVEQVERDAALLERLEEQLLFDADAAVEDADLAAYSPQSSSSCGASASVSGSSDDDLELGAAAGALGDFVLHHLGERDVGKAFGALRLPGGGRNGMPSLMDPAEGPEGLIVVVQFVLALHARVVRRLLLVALLRRAASPGRASIPT